MTVFESPVLSLEDQATALEVAAEAFNERGGANGSCIEVTTCDDGGQRRPGGGVRADDRRRRRGRDRQRPGHRRPGRGVGRRWPQAKIPRVASNVTQDDWGDPNAYPLDASGTGVTFLMPQALIEADVNEDRPHPGRPGRRVRADRACSRTPTRAKARPSPTTSRSRPAPPTSPSSSSARRTKGADGVVAGARRAGGRPGREGRPAARAPSCSSGRASARSRTRTSPTSATSPSRWCSSGRTRRRRPTSPCTRRCGPTSRRPARRRSSPRTSRPARCARGSASTRCSR